MSGASALCVAPNAKDGATEVAVTTDGCIELKVSDTSGQSVVLATDATAVRIFKVKQDVQGTRPNGRFVTVKCVENPITEEETVHGSQGDVSYACERRNIGARLLLENRDQAFRKYTVNCFTQCSETQLVRKKGLHGRTKRTGVQEFPKGTSPRRARVPPSVLPSLSTKPESDGRLFSRQTCGSESWTELSLTFILIVATIPIDDAP